MFIWTPDMIRFMHDAYEYKSWHGELASLISSRDAAHGSICDAGCGLGYLSLSLCGYYQAVTASDISSEALSVLRNISQKNNVENLTVRQEDMLASDSTEKFDSMVFCFFGTTEETLKVLLRRCRGRAFLIKKHHVLGRGSRPDSPYGPYNYTHTSRRLSELGIPFSGEEAEFDMGQPFRTLEDAAAFYAAYDRMYVSLEELLSRLTQTDNAEFPYYLPIRRSVGFITLDMQDIPFSVNTALL